MKSYVYLHGFASSPASSKARYFETRFAERGITLEIPALDGGDFEHLTLSAQLRLIESLLDGRPAALIGSSLGGYLAALYAERHPEIERVVLMAPAFEFAVRFGQRLGADALNRWRADGTIPIYHYKFNREVSLHYGLYEDALRHPPFPNVKQPTLILHGAQDETVPVELSERFCELHPSAELRLFDSGHELTDVLPALWEEAEKFLLV
jgi:hypothetical protein